MGKWKIFKSQYKGHDRQIIYISIYTPDLPCLFCTSLGGSADFNYSDIYSDSVPIFKENMDIPVFILSKQIESQKWNNECAIILISIDM